MPVSINGNGAISGLAITTADLSDGSVTTAKIASGAVATVDIADSAVTTAKIADANVTVAKISATGTPSSTTYLRGDGSWQTVSTTPTTDQVLTATAGASVGAVGTYAECSTTNATAYNPGATIAGSSLRYTRPVNFGGVSCGSYQPSSSTAEPRFGTAPSGTWRCMGYITGGSFQVTLWLRIS